MEEELGKNPMQQALVSINPEIERRQKLGSLQDGFVLRKAQVITDLDTGAPEIRLNEEVRAVAKARAARTLDKCEEVTEADLDNTISSNSPITTLTSKGLNP